MYNMMFKISIFIFVKKEEKVLDRLASFSLHHRAGLPSSPIGAGNSSGVGLEVAGLSLLTHMQIQMVKFSSKIENTWIKNSEFRIS